MDKNSKNYQSKYSKKLFKDIDEILLLPGFGSREVRGKIHCSRFARENDVPFLGICLIQCAITDFARNVCGLSNANPTEFTKNTNHPVISLMESQKAIKIKGGTMEARCIHMCIKRKTHLYNAYKETKVTERHRHRYEFNNKYLKRLEKDGLIFSGVNPDLKVVEVLKSLGIHGM